MTRMFSVALFTLLILPFSAAAQQSTTATYGSWTVECRKSEAGDNLCEMTQTLNLQQSGEMIAKIAIGRLPGSSETLIVFQMRAGVWLRDPIVLAATDSPDAVAVSATYTQCQNGFCFADAPLSEPMIVALSGPEPASLSYTGQGRRAIKLPLALDGFGEALKAALAE